MIESAALESWTPIQRFLSQVFWFGWIIRVEAECDLKFKNSQRISTRVNKASNMPLLKDSDLASFAQLTVSKILHTESKMSGKMDQGHREMKEGALRVL